MAHAHTHNRKRKQVKQKTWMVKRGAKAPNDSVCLGKKQWKVGKTHQNECEFLCNVLPLFVYLCWQCVCMMMFSRSLSLFPIWHHLHELLCTGKSLDMAFSLKSNISAMMRHSIAIAIAIIIGSISSIIIFGYHQWCLGYILYRKPPNAADAVAAAAVAYEVS